MVTWTSHSVVQFKFPNFNYWKKLFLNSFTYHQLTVRMTPTEKHYIFNTLVHQVANSLADWDITHLMWSANIPAPYINGPEVFSDDVLWTTCAAVNNTKRAYVFM